MKYTAEEIQMATESLLRDLEGVDEIALIVRHVSPSGMTRWIDPLILVHGTGMGHRVATVLGWTYSDKHRGVKVEGAGMDMGFHLVSTLCRVLYQDDYKIRHRWL